MQLRGFRAILVSTLTLTAIGCGSSNTPAGTGGSTGSGGATGTGGASSTGGRSGTGGATASGGATGTGGASATGGATGTGGAATGGRGGAAAVGGRGGGAGAPAGTGGRGGGAGAPAGVGGRGGGAGAPAAGGAGGTAAATMSFFVTSRGPGNGGNLAGLVGADTFCTTLAAAVSPALGAKTWHAYLSTSTMNARDRIGAGPWYNAAGRLIANNLTDLHDQIAANAALNATWPIADTTIALDENGAPVPSNPLVHDILTGSTTDGMVMAGATCNDWTSQAATDIAQIGHSNRDGGGRPPSWNSAHATTGCAQPTGGTVANTVGSGGGRGSLYCFAVP